jgi:hypothetical protein
MTVFVWKYYGTIDVYDASDPRTCDRLLEDVVEALTNRKDRFGGVIDHLRHLRNSTEALQFLCGSAGIVGETDAFQSGTGFYPITILL